MATGNPWPLASQAGQVGSFREILVHWKPLILCGALLCFLAVFTIPRSFFQNSLITSLYTQAHPVSDWDARAFILSLGLIFLTVWITHRAGTEKTFCCPMNRAQVPEVAGMKALGAMMIILFHWQPYGNFYLSSRANDLRLGGGLHSMNELMNWGFQFGYLAVGLFIILSGLGLSMAYYREMAEGNGIGWKKFYFQRSMKILPLYWIVVTLSFLLAYYSGQKVTFQGAAAGITLLSNYYRPWYAEMAVANQPLWFIPLIFGLYGLFPFLIWLRRNVGDKLFLIILLGFSVMYHNVFVWIAPLGRVGEFGLGIVLGARLSQNPEGAQRRMRGYLPVCGGLFLVITLVYLSTTRLHYGWIQPILPILLFFVLWPLISGVLRKRSFLRVLTWTGSSSYAAYLLHPLFLKLLSPFFNEQRTNCLLGFIFVLATLFISRGAAYGDFFLREKLRTAWKSIEWWGVRIEKNRPMCIGRFPMNKNDMPGR